MTKPLPTSLVEAPDQQPDTLNQLQILSGGGSRRQALGADAESLALVKDEAVPWPDASLGCPQEGMMYAQVITPGHRMTFRHNEDTYKVHTADAGSSMDPVSCEGGVSY